MRVVLFCGGLGLRMRALVETHGEVRRRAADAPKPMIEVGDQPLLWHIMKWYAHYGHRDFVLCLGHRGEVIRDWLCGLEHSGIEQLDAAVPAVRIQLTEPGMEGWTITLAETGAETVVGQRLMKVREFVEDDEYFLANYADGLSDAPLPELVQLSRESDSVGTFLAVPLASSLHMVTFSATGHVDAIGPLESSELWINGGFFVLRRDIFSYIQDGEDLVVEPFERLIKENALAALRYNGFWVALDTAKDHFRAEGLWRSTRPWAIWEEPVAGELQQT